MNLAFICLIDETCATHAANINLSVLDVFHKQTLDAEWNNNLWVGDVLNDYILFPLIIICSFDNIRVITNVFDFQVVTCKYALIDIIRSLAFFSLYRLLCLCFWFLSLSHESKLLLGHRLLLLLSEDIVKLIQCLLALWEHASWYCVLIVWNMVS